MLNVTLSPLKKLRHGFTLIELLVVIAVLGILAAVVLVAVDPLEQIARGRDAGRVNTIAQLGHALQSYATTTNQFPADSAAWQQTLKDAGEIKQLVSVAKAKTSCSKNAVNEICYKPLNAGLTDAVVWTVLDSKNSISKAGNCTTTVVAIYSTIKGQAGVACVTSADTVDGTEVLK